MNYIFDHTEILPVYSACKFVIADDVTLAQGEIIDFILFKVCYLMSVLLQTELDSYVTNYILYLTETVLMYCDTKVHTSH